LRPQAINDAGTIVGTDYRGLNDYEQIVWERGQRTRLVADGIGTELTDINAQGSVLGSSIQQIGPDFVYRPWIWANSRAEPVAGPSGAVQIEKLNDAGDLAGATVASANGRLGITVWRDTTTTTYTPPINAINQIDIRDFTNTGLVLAEYDECIFWDFGGEPFIDPECSYEHGLASHVILWDSVHGGVREVDDQLNALNDSGVGATRKLFPYTEYGMPFSYSRAARWENGQYTVVDTVAPGDRNRGSVALDINNQGDLVGTLYVYDGFSSQSQKRGMLWDATGTHDLTELVAADDWVITDAELINNRGQIVGYGERKGIRSAVLLTPLPTTPLILIPGITGSILNSADGRNQWPNNLPFTELSLNPRDPHTTITASWPILGLPTWLPVIPVYGPLLTMLTKEGGYRLYNRPNAQCNTTSPVTQPTLFVFPYDWRLSNAENATHLNQYIDCVARFSPTGQVDIVAHSMGGILARRAILDRPPASRTIRRLVTIGTPWLGTPQALYVLETGQIGLGFNFLLHNFPFLSQLVQVWPGAHELLPTPDYFALGGRPFREAGWDMNLDGQDTTTYATYATFTDMLDHRYRHSLPGSTNQTFYRDPRQTAWFGSERGIATTHIIGTQRYPRTINQVIAREFGDCNFWSGRSIRCALRSGYDYTTTWGDDTVPFMSGTRLAFLNGVRFNLNGRGARLIELRERESGDVSHIGLLNNRTVHSAVLGALTLPESANAQAGQQQQQAPPETDNEQQPELTLDQSVATVERLRLRGTSVFTVTNALGETTTIISGSMQLSIPSATILQMHEDSADILLGSELPYTVTLQADSLFTAEWATGTVTTTDATRKWLDHADLGGKTLQFVRTPSSTPHLSVDSDSDGRFDEVITPTVDLAQESGVDTQPPDITISTIPELQAQLRIEAHDNSGIERILFSIDGIVFESLPSDGIVSVPPWMTLTILADDHAGNREIRRYTLSNATVFLPFVYRTATTAP
jgi:pimeloyl-ACP methyl ester carboxylesterase